MNARKGRDTRQMAETVSALKANPALAKFEFPRAQPLDFGKGEPLDDQGFLRRGG